ncbi:FAD-dependent oxidoreductase [Nesterenkonia lutea]
MVLGLILARAGLRVTVLEKHEDFLRDFRGDTVHPSTLTLLGELGLRERFLALPVTALSTLDGVIEGQRITLVDFGALPSPDDFLVMVPQWDFLNFLAREARRLPTFELRMGTEATGLLHEDEDRQPLEEKAWDVDAAVRGLRATSPSGVLEIRATLTVAADGRDSGLRRAAGLIPEESGVPIDVLWFSLPKPPDPTPPTLGHLSSAGMVLTIDRGDSCQSGLIIKKGEFTQMRRAGLDAFHARLTQAAPVLGPVVGTLTEWRQVKLLTVQMNRLPHWYRPGFIAIGDAAHAMSPMFGVGVNFAIQDAVALANAIVPDLRRGAAPVRTLARVQSRRERPVKVMQRIQGRGHRVIARSTTGRRVLPRPMVALIRLASPALRRVAAHVIGQGLFPEHVHTGSVTPRGGHGEVGGVPETWSKTRLWHNEGN